MGSFANCAIGSRLGKVNSSGVASRPTNGFKGVAEPVTNWRARPDLPAAHALTVPIAPAFVAFNSTSPRNEAGHTGLHHRVAPDVRRYALANLLYGVFRQARNVKILLDTRSRV